ncbi:MULTISPECIES: DMT family transporter [Bacillus]|uniref:DMT family transporter n=1 Tax=Bacillus TaxID=1386 RepID=UPI0005356907|nr:DMT family transporter [Bacillus pseudomycoides]MED1596977.1 DMT family transporter [Bacillus pseudomycoides]MED4712933.1 DMT family transporter [Bacillus pseudomycoides]OOR52373.1 EamA family transporter [Bacillus pseudomycoides]PDY13353.1 EamA family transporter [Bacillus pseudomycoides]PEU34570.1 EamA family transporter [Bacillus pseudomycoides]
MNNNRRLGLIMIITGATLWGVSGPMIQWLFQHTKVSSIDFLVIRLLLAGVFILCFLLTKKQNIFRIWQHPRHLLQLIIFSILGMLGAQYAFIETVHISNAVTATLFQFLGPVLITIYVAVQHKKLPSIMQVLAIVSALTGTYFIITNGSAQNIVLSKEAILFGVLTAIGFAFYTLHPASLIKQWGTTLIIGWGMLIGGLALFICNRSFEWKQLSQTFTLQTFSMLILIIVSGTLSFLLYIGSLKYLSATETSILSSIEPLVAAIVSITWLKESFGAYQLLGGVCIVIAVIFLTMPAKDAEPTFTTEQI